MQTTINARSLMPCRQVAPRAALAPCAGPAPSKSPLRAAFARRVTAATRSSRLAVRAVAAPATPNDTDQLAADKLKNFKVAVFSSQQYVKDFMAPMQEIFPNSTFIEERLSHKSAIKASGYDAVCLFVNDHANDEILDTLAQAGVKYIAMRCAGFDRVDISAAYERGMRVARVPTYSPASVAEHALALLLTIARKLNLAIPRVKEGNYTVSGLTGRELANCNFGIIGTGAIGAVMVKLALGFQKHTGEKPHVYCYDLYPRQDLIDAGAEYVELDTLLAKSDAVSLHCPLLPSTFHLINRERIALMKDGALLVNVSRGGLVDTSALLDALYEGKFGGVAMDVYEKEGNLFFKDYTSMANDRRIKNWDREFAQLKALPNVVITPHIAFSTTEALTEICNTTIANLAAFCLDEEVKNEVKPQPQK